MSKWRAKALELFPELRDEIQRSGTLGELWIELSAELHAYLHLLATPDTRKVRDFARNVHAYALWCHGATDWRTREAAHTEFFEEMLPFAIRSGQSTYDRVVEDLVAYIGVPTIKNNAVSFGYSLSAEQLTDFVGKVDQVAKRRTRRSATE
jgi:hypothetical protein